jgi:EmrB/QacA subfamily drug resistance transporter
MAMVDTLTDTTAQELMLDPGGPLAPAETAARATPSHGVRKWLPLITMGLAVVIIVLDTTLLNVSLGTIVRELHTSITSLQWVITAYSLTLAALTIAGGRLGDLFGRKRMFVAGAVIFAAGSMLASLAASVPMLIIGESIIEGIGAALMLPATASLLVASYRGRDRALALGIWGGMAAAGAAIGPVLGGYLTTHYSWRWGFRINVFVAALLVCGSLFIRDSRDREEKASIDFAGIALSSLGLLAGVFAIIEGSAYGWWRAHGNLRVLGHSVAPGGLSVVPVLIAVSLVLLGMFVAWEQRLTSRGGTPLVSMKLFANGQFTAGASLTAAMSLGQIGLTFCIPVFLQSVRGLDALHTGYALLPLSAALLVTAPLGGYLAAHVNPKRLVQAGLFISVVGLIFLRHVLNASTTSVDLIAPLAIYAAGLGLGMSQLGNITMSAVSVNQAGEASGVNNTLRQIGSSLGTAVIGSVLIASIAGGLSGGVKSSATINPVYRAAVSREVKAQASAVEFGGRLTSSQPLTLAERLEIKQISNQATVRADRTALIFTIVFTAIGFLLAMRLPNTRNVERSQSLASPD